MALFVNQYTNLGVTPVTVSPPFPKPMTQALIVASPDTGNDQVIVTVQGQSIPIGEGILLKLEQPGPFQLSGTSGNDSAFVICMQSDNYQLTGKLVEVEAAGGGGGGGGGTYSADGVTLQLIGTTFSIRNGGVNTTQLANNAVDADKIAAAVAGAGLTGGAGTALAVQVDNVGIEIPVDTLQLKDLGVTNSKIAGGAVTEPKLGAQSVTLSAQGAGSYANPSLGRCSQLSTNGNNLIPGDTLLVDLRTPAIGVQSILLTAVAGAPGVGEFEIGGTPDVTLANYVAALQAAMGGDGIATSNSPTNDYALIGPAIPGYPFAYAGSGQSVAAIFSGNGTSGAWTTSTTSDVVSGSNPTWSRQLTGLYCTPIEVQGADVSRGFIAVRPPPASTFLVNNSFAPFLLRKDSSGVTSQCGSEVVYDATLDAWTITNTGTDDYANGDTLLLISYVQVSA